VCPRRCYLPEYQLTKQRQQFRLDPGLYAPIRITLQTDIYYSIAKRQGRALLAQKVVAQYFSETLGEDPWVREVENLIKTSLARTQINAWSVASGEDSVHEGKDGYISLTENCGDLCGKFKYNPRGYHSLRFIPFIVIVCSLPALLLLILEWKPLERKTKLYFHDVKQYCCNAFIQVRLQKSNPRHGSNNPESRQVPPDDAAPDTVTPSIPASATE
jgi:hypothetical protein